MAPQDGTPGGNLPRDHAAAPGVAGGCEAIFAMREATKVAGVSTSTLRRRKAALVETGAVIADTGWQVPMTALIAVGLIPGEREGWICLDAQN